MADTGRPADDSPKTLLLVSGGPDSGALAALVEREARDTGKYPPNVSAIYLRTGEPSDDKEIEAANRVMERIGGRLEIIDLRDTMQALGGSRLMIHSEADLMPFGNAVALSIATAYALKIGATRVMLALHADDAAENLEYTREFIERINDLARFGQRRAPSIEVPFIDMTKAEVIRLGLDLGVDFAATWSCIRRGDLHCGSCGACRARRRAFDVIGAVDPTVYASEPLALTSLGPSGIGQV